MSFSGRGEVKTVTGVESGLSALLLEGERLFSGLYVNELLSRLLLNHVEHRQLYQAYQDTLIALQGSSDIEVILRGFELTLLAELGYAINLESDCRDHNPIEGSSNYRFTPGVGFELTADAASENNNSDAASENNNSNLFDGSHVIALRDLNLSDKDTAKSAKRLLRLALNTHLGDKPIHSRKLFVNRM